MQNLTATETTARQAELHAILADKGLEAATETAKARILEGLTDYPQYGPQSFEGFELRVATRGGGRFKGGTPYETGDLVLTKVERPVFTGPGFETRITVWATRGLERACEVGPYAGLDPNMTALAYAEAAR